MDNVAGATHKSPEVKHMSKEICNNLFIFQVKNSDCECGFIFSSLLSLEPSMGNAYGKDCIASTKLVLKCGEEIH